MKFAFLSDPHLVWDNPIARLDDAKETGLKKFEFVLKWCSDNNAALCIAGDLTDKPRGWHLYKRLVVLLKRYGVKVYCVYGQHDMYLRSKEATILDLLERSGLIKILGKEPEYFNRIYGCSWGEEVPKIEQGLFNILVIHAPIHTEPLFFDHEYMDAKRFVNKHKFNLVHCGDIHRNFFILSTDYTKCIFNTGPMLRKSAEEYNFIHKPMFYVYDEGADQFWEEEIPHEPAEKILSRDHLERKKESDQMLDDFVHSINEDFEADTDFYDNLERFMDENDVGQEVINCLSDIMEED